MDIATVLGLIIGTGLIIVSMFIEGSKGGIPITEFWSTSSMLIVLGGTLAATAIAFRMNEVSRVLLLIKFAFTKPKFVLHELVKELIDLAELSRKGPAELEKEISNIKTFFIKDGVELYPKALN